MSAGGVEDGYLAGTRFAFLSYYDFNLYRFRLPIMRRLAGLGARVFAVAPPSGAADLFEQHGIEFVPFGMRGAGLDPVHDLQGTARMHRLIGSLRPDVLQTFMLKPNLLGGLAARRADGTHVISTVTGLGRLYEEGNGLKTRSLRWGAEQVMRRAFEQVSAVVFQNPDDRDELLGRRVCRPDQARLIPSSGVDLDEFSPTAVEQRTLAALRTSWGIRADEPVVTMVARLLPSKGVREFAAAARALAGRARFVLIGPLETTRRATAGAPVPADEVTEWQRSGDLVAPGQQDHVEEWLALSDVYALPSYYREGVPRSVLEAMSMGLPIVTTDMPGCRETVVHGSNGYLVPPRDTDALVDALGKLLDDPEMRQRMGEASRSLAQRRFSSAAVVGQHLALYRELLGQAARV